MHTCLERQFQIFNSKNVPSANAKLEHATLTAYPVVVKFKYIKISNYFNYLNYIFTQVNKMQKLEAVIFNYKEKL